MLLNDVLLLRLWRRLLVDVLHGGLLLLLLGWC